MIEKLFENHAETAKAMEFPLCPTYEEMALRFKSKVKSCLLRARQATDPFEARQHFEDALAYRNVAKHMMDQHTQIIRRIKY